MIKGESICCILLILFVTGSALLKPTFLTVIFNELKSYKTSLSLLELTGSRYALIIFEQQSKLNFQNNISKKINFSKTQTQPRLFGHEISLGNPMPHSQIPETVLNDFEVKIELRVPGVEVSPTSKTAGRGINLLVCVGPFPIPNYYVGWTIIRVVPKINVIGIQHIIAYGEPEWKDRNLEPEVAVDYYGNGCEISTDGIFFAWSRTGMVENSQLPVLEFPEGTGFPTLLPSDFRVLFLEVHYEPVSEIEFELFKDTSGIDVVLSKIDTPVPLSVAALASYRWNLPPDQVNYEVCQEFLLDESGFDERGMKVYGARGHAHIAGREIYTTVHRNGTFIGTLSPVFPFQTQAFYFTEKNVFLKPGDSLALHCIYSTLGRNWTTSPGMGSWKDEMCNHYLITEASGKSITVPGYNIYNGAVDGDRNPKWNGACAPTFPRVELKESFLSQPNGIGEISGISLNAGGELFLFHRAGRNFGTVSTTTITEPTILKYSPEGELIAEFGANIFYMPHGLTCDCVGDLWVTDLLANRVVQLSGESGKFERELNGNFGKPAGVAFDRKCSKIYIADGYVNSRVAVYDYDSGNFLFDFGSYGAAAGQFNIVHDVAVDDNDLIYVADKLNFRVQVFSKDGRFLSQWSDLEPTPHLSFFKYWHKHLSAITFDARLSILWTIQSGSLVARTKAGLEIARVDGPFDWPHDVEVSKSGDIYVAELEGSKIYQYSLSDKIKDAVTIPLHYFENDLK